MKKLFCFVSIIVLIFVSFSFGQDIAVVYDASVEDGGGIVVQNPKQLADLIVEKLEEKKLTAEIVDSDALIEYMNANPKGIYVLAQGTTPGTIFKNQGKNDLVYSWLRDGGIGAMIGDFPFYYYWDKGERIEPAVGGQQSVFGFQVTQAVQAEVKPTVLGKQYIPSLKNWTTDRPLGLSVLRQNNFEFESYADDGTYADPIAFRTNDMEGWYINFHTSCCGPLYRHMIK